MIELLDHEFWNNPARDWALAAGVWFGVTVLLRLVVLLLISRISKLASKTTTQIDDAVIGALRRTRFLTFLMLGVIVAERFVVLPSELRSVMHRVILVWMLVQAGLWVAHAISAWLRGYRSRQLENDRGAATAVGAISFVVQLGVWSLVLLIVLDNLGIDVTALVTGLGIGGIAVALALQNVLGDLFASLSIVFDKPFVIGDFLIVGEHLGTVENVGLKTTRLRSLSGEQLVFANSDLLGSRVRNFGRMYERRVLFHLGVTYQTVQDDVKAIPGIIREAIEEQENTRFDRSNFQKFGDYALIFESVYFIGAPDYNLYMAIQEQINLRIRERFAAAGIEFAYPTQTLYVQGSEPVPNRE